MRESVRINEHLLIPISELRFVTSRSGGPGGQNVNKLETRVELIFNITQSRALTESQKYLISARLKSRIDAEGCIHVGAQESRSQWQNKQHAINRLVILLKKALKPAKKRVRTLPSRQSEELRIQRKRKTGEKKKLRKVGSFDE